MLRGGHFGARRDGTRDRAVVEIDSVTLVGLAPGVTDTDEKDADAPAGNPEAVNVTGLAYAPLEEATVSVYCADCPGETDAVELTAVTA